MLEEGRRLGVALPLTSITQQLATATAAAGRARRIWPLSSRLWNYSPDWNMIVLR